MKKWRLQKRRWTKFLWETYLLDTGMLVIIHPLMFLKRLKNPWIIFISYHQYHKGVVLESSSINNRGDICKSGQDTMLWQCCPIGNMKKRKHPRRRSHTRHQSILSVMTIDFDIPKDFIKYNNGGIHTIPHWHLNFLIPLEKKNAWPLYYYKKIIRQVPRIPPRALSEFCESAYQWILLSGDHGQNGRNFEIRGWFRGINWVVKVSSW